VKTRFDGFVLAVAIAAAALFVTIAASAGDAGLVQTAAVAPQPTALAASADDEHYVLGAGDKVKIVVYGEDDLGGEFAIDGSGHVQLPLIGQIKAAGLTLHQFVAAVTTSLQNGYLKDPKVSAQVMNYRPFYIIGEVNKPGEYPYENGLTILRAVALAGGYTYRANDDKVYVRRVNDAEESKMPADSKTRIYPGDIVRVPERIF
jgi:polysaccharide export outer membrane protein